MTTQYTNNFARMEVAPEDNRVICSGDWTAMGIAQLSETFCALVPKGKNKLTLDGSGIGTMDSAGAFQLQQCIEALNEQVVSIELKGFSEAQLEILSLVGKELGKLKLPTVQKLKENLLYFIGESTVSKLKEVGYFLNFIGELSQNLFSIIKGPRNIQWTSLLVQIEETGYQALPIVALLSFLVGIVLAYQMGVELKAYGANIYIVNVTGLAILREFGALITAIIVAGRTGSAFTAQIGSMKVHEEIDALLTMGLSPVNRLVIPKVLGLLIAMPLLVVWADFFGLLGSMVMSNLSLDIGYVDFIQRLEEVIDLRDYLLGISKAPTFALIIAIVGCFQGLRVKMTADSVGKQTTVSVVQSIFLIIIADAIYSVLFSWRNL